MGMPTEKPRKATTVHQPAEVRVVAMAGGNSDSVKTMLKKRCKVPLSKQGFRARRQVSVFAVHVARNKVRIKVRKEAERFEARNVAAMYNTAQGLPTDEFKGSHGVSHVVVRVGKHRYSHRFNQYHGIVRRASRGMHWPSCVDGPPQYFLCLSPMRALGGAGVRSTAPPASSFQRFLDRVLWLGLDFKRQSTMKRKIDLLKAVEILTGLQEGDLQTIAALSHYRRYPEGRVIFEKGATSKSFFIVESGEVGIMSSAHTAAEAAIAYFIPDEIFGEFDLFEGDTRTAQAVAAEDSRLLVFPKEGEDFQRIAKRHAGIFARIYSNLLTLNAGRIRRTNGLVSDRTRWVEELRRQMLFDKLTGLYNRSFLDDEFPKELSRMTEPISVLVVKPDNFKAINDAFGHEAGDEVLKALADTTRSCLDKDDLAIRFRGNEFVLILPKTTQGKAFARAEHLLNTLSSLDVGEMIEQKSLKLTFSIGIVVYPDHAADSGELVEKAFDRMFEQRNRGGDGVLVAGRTEEDLVGFLKTVAVFAGLYLNEIHHIAQHLNPVSVKSGQAICKQGEQGDDLFIIEAGTAGISIQLPDNSQKEIASCSAGDFFGEMAIFEDAVRSATCVAKEDSTVLKLSKYEFFNLMESAPATAIKIMKNMLNITSSRLNATGRFLSEMVRWGNEAGKRAITDQLTGVFNRRYLETALEEKISVAKQENSPFVLIMADLDYFREVNEGYSHEIGDKYIIEVARTFQACLRETDIVARYGGDEFTLLLPDTTLETAQELAESIRHAVQQLDFLDAYTGPQIRVSTSLGVAAYPQSSSDLKQLRELADQALYRAKETGRNRVVCAE